MQSRTINNVGFKWSDVSSFRAEMFGLAIISIVIFHYFEGVAGADYVSTVLKRAAMVFNGAIGSVGVDIFVLLSGFGISYSLSRALSIKQYFSKCFERVVLPYLMVGLIFWIVKDLVLQHKAIPVFLYDYSFLSF